MAKTYLGVSGIAKLIALFKGDLNAKQDKLTGTKGQYVGFDEDGELVPVRAPEGAGADEIIIGSEFPESYKVQIDPDGDGLDFDSEPTEGSKNILTSGVIKGSLDTKQDKLSGISGQVVGFDGAGNAIAQPAPVTGMTQTDGDNRYLKLTGGSLSGPLTLSGAPSAASHATTKSYVDSKIIYGTTDLTEGVSPLATGCLYVVYEQ